MPDRPGRGASRYRRPRVGLIVNPIAGLGGRVGLNGSDGEGTVARAIELGARPQASHRAAEALRALVSAWPASLPRPELLVAPGPMGEDAARGAGLEDTVSVEVLPDAIGVPTTADDTRHLAARLASAGVDLLLFAGGDGTARDVHEGIGNRADTQPVLGVPAGVKIQSAVYATSPAVAGRLAADWLGSARRRAEEREVLDLDEAAYRRGEVRPALHGYLRVPAERGVQDRKAPTPPDDSAALGGIAEAVAEDMRRAGEGVLCVLGPGTTVRAVAERLGVPKTLIGVDVVEWHDGLTRVVAQDAGEQAILHALDGRPARIFVTPIGGQGFLFGRGNLPISPAVIRAAACGRPPRETVIVVAAPGKLSALGGRPLLVDTGDPGLDAELAGHVTVITGYRDRAVIRVAVA